MAVCGLSLILWSAVNARFVHQTWDQDITRFLSHVFKTCRNKRLENKTNSYVYSSFQVNMPFLRYNVHLCHTYCKVIQEQPKKNIILETPLNNLMGAEIKETWQL